MGDDATGRPPVRLDKFHRELEDLKEKLLDLAQMAETAINQSVTALLNRDADLARQVISGDKAINDLEEFIDGECVRLIALYQPVATDLRQLMAVDHIVGELERIGDLAVNIAEEVVYLGQFPPREYHRGLPIMTQKVLEMLRHSLQSFMHLDARRARQVCKADKEVEDLDQNITEDLLGLMVEDEAIPFGHSLIKILHHLERSGDHTTNIAEQVVYMVEGESIRHRCLG
jgi:phosphate transport system protein